MLWRWGRFLIISVNILLWGESWQNALGATSTCVCKTFYVWELNSVSATNLRLSFKSGKGMSQLLFRFLHWGINKGSIRFYLVLSFIILPFYTRIIYFSTTDFFPRMYFNSPHSNKSISLSLCRGLNINSRPTQTSEWFAFLSRYMRLMKSDDHPVASFPEWGGKNRPWSHFDNVWISECVLSQVAKWWPDVRKRFPWHPYITAPPQKHFDLPKECDRFTEKMAVLLSSTCSTFCLSVLCISIYVWCACIQGIFA